MDEVDQATIRTLADELAIRNLLARLAHIADTGSIDEVDDYVALFTEDATWAVPSDGVLPAQERQGHDAIRAAARARREDGTQGPGANRRHIISTTTVEFPTDDKASVRSCWQRFDQTLADVQVSNGIGEYHDTFVRTPDGWKLARREIFFG